METYSDGITNLRVKNTFLEVIQGDEESDGGSSKPSSDPTSSRSSSVSKSETSASSEVRKALVIKKKSDTNTESSQSNQQSSDSRDDSKGCTDGNKTPVPLGSKLHSVGGCHPCHYAYSKGGCTKGDSCEFCHLSHPKRVRPCKSKRSKCKRLVGMLDDVYASDPGQLDNAVHNLSQSGAYMSTAVKGKLRQLAQTEEDGGSVLPVGQQPQPAKRSLMSL